VSSLMSMLQVEEQRLLADLQSNPLLEKFDAVSRLVSLYSGGPSEAIAAIDLLMSRWEPERPVGGIVTGNLLSMLQAEVWDLMSDLRRLPAVEKLKSVRRVIALYSEIPANEQGPPATDLRYEGLVADRAAAERQAPAPATVHRDPPARAVSTVRAALMAVTGARDTALAS